MANVIFLVDDDEDIARLLQHHLEKSGYSARTFLDAGKALAEAEKSLPALFLVDVILPGMDGLELCRRIRNTRSLAATPVIFISARQDEADRVVGLELGADDYITKPFSPRELVARVKAVLRRYEPPPGKELIRVGAIEINVAAMSLSISGRAVALTVTEFRLLEFLARHSGRVFSREQLLKLVWKDSPAVARRCVDVYVRRLREKIEPEPKFPRYLKTIRGAGYRFDDVAASDRQ